MTNDVQKNQARLPRFRPETDILEKEDGFHVFMDVPGVRKDALVIDLKENQVVITATAEYPGDEGRTAIETEFGSGVYERTFTLSDAVDRENIKANLKNGVLEIFMPKAEKILPKRIEISTG